MENLWTGKRVRLTAFDPDIGGELLAKWYADSEFTRLYDLPPVMVKDTKRTQAALREQAGGTNPQVARFLIQTLANEQFIGEGELERNLPTYDEAFVSIGLGDRAFWGKGYGTEAMDLLLRHGFCEWNVHRISLSVYAYNPRAIRSYEKIGMKHEGRRRAQLLRGGARFDMLYMGILRREWEAAQHG